MKTKIGIVAILNKALDKNSITCNNCRHKNIEGHCNVCNWEISDDYANHIATEIVGGEKKSVFTYMYRT